jgi:hypothetical protein
VKTAEQRCKKQARDLVGSIQFAFRRRYNLAPTDPRFLDATTEDILSDHWTHIFHAYGVKVEEVEDDEFVLEAAIKSMDDGDWEEVK